MKYYSITGSNTCITVEAKKYTPQKEEIKMSGPRPSPNHVAQADGTWALPVAAFEQIQAALIQAVQNLLDTKAKEKGYDNILSACSYAGSADPIFAAEGNSCLIWRDNVWRKCYEILAEVKAGTREIPAQEELIAALPVLVWPG